MKLTIDNVKVGDSLICINGEDINYLTYGKIYKVLKDLYVIDDDGDTYYLPGSTRFNFLSDTRDEKIKKY